MASAGIFVIVILILVFAASFIVNYVQTSGNNQGAVEGSIFWWPSTAHCQQTSETTAVCAVNGKSAGQGYNCNKDSVGNWTCVYGAITCCPGVLCPSRMAICPFYPIYKNYNFPNTADCQTTAIHQATCTDNWGHSWNCATSGSSVPWNCLLQHFHL